MMGVRSSQRAKLLVVSVQPRQMTGECDKTHGGCRIRIAGVKRAQSKSSGVAILHYSSVAPANIAVDAYQRQLMFAARLCGVSRGEVRFGELQRPVEIPLLVLICGGMAVWKSRICLYWSCRRLSNLHAPTAPAQEPPGEHGHLQKAAGRISGLAPAPNQWTPKSGSVMLRRRLPQHCLLETVKDLFSFATNRLAWPKKSARLERAQSGGERARDDRQFVKKAL
jgi:hypothetical protein